MKYQDYEDFVNYRMQHEILTCSSKQSFQKKQSLSAWIIAGAYSSYQEARSLKSQTSILVVQLDTPVLNRQASCATAPPQKSLQFVPMLDQLSQSRFLGRQFQNPTCPQTAKQARCCLRFFLTGPNRTVTSQWTNKRIS